MNCFEVEKNLPAYVDRDLPQGKREEIKRHVSSCSACKDSLGVFLALEEVLMEIGMKMPSSEHAAKKIISTIRKEEFGDLIRSVFSLPVQIGLVFVLTGLVLGRFIGRVEQVISMDFSIFYKVTHATSWLAKSVARISSNGDFLTNPSFLSILAFLMLAMACFVFDRLRDSA